MSQEVTLFILRVLAALALLAFMGVIAWFIYRDIKLITHLQSHEFEKYGELQLIGETLTDSLIERSFPLYPVTSIGRAASNSIVLDDDFVSARHVLITLRGSQWWIEDLESRNGTNLNSFPLEVAVVVTAGDIISIGTIKLRIEF
jgi:hypothetical protein